MRKCRFTLVLGDEIVHKSIVILCFLTRTGMAEKAHRYGAFTFMSLPIEKAKRD